MIKVLKFCPDMMDEWPFGDDVVMKIDDTITHTSVFDFLLLVCQPHNVQYVIENVNIDCLLNDEVFEAAKQLGKYRHTTIKNEDILNAFDKVWKYVH